MLIKHVSLICVILKNNPIGNQKFNYFTHEENLTIIINSQSCQRIWVTYSSMIWVEYFSFAFFYICTCKYLTQKQSQTYFKTCEDEFLKQMKKAYKCLMTNWAPKTYIYIYKKKNKSHK
jgi:hypothetical protein